MQDLLTIENKLNIFKFYLKQLSVSVYLVDSSRMINITWRTSPTPSTNIRPANQPRKNNELFVSCSQRWVVGIRFDRIVEYEWNCVIKTQRLTSLVTDHHL